MIIAVPKDLISEPHASLFLLPNLSVCSFGTIHTYIQVKVTLGVSKGVAIVEWKASPAGDVIADSVVALLMHAQSSTASIRLTSKPCRHPRDDGDDQQQGEKKQRSSKDNSKERLRFIYLTLKDQFDNVEATYEGNKGTFEISTDCGLESSSSSAAATASSATEDDSGGRRKTKKVLLTCLVRVKLDDSSAQTAEITVECSDDKLAKNVRECLRNVVAATVPIKPS